MKSTTQRNQYGKTPVFCQIGFLARRQGATEEIVRPYSDEGAMKSTTQRNQYGKTLACQGKLGHGYADLKPDLVMLVWIQALIHKIDFNRTT